MLHLRSIDDIKSWLAMPGAGTVETTAAPFWRTLRELRPDCRIATIRRDPEACVESICRIIPETDVAVTRKLFRKIDAKLDQIEARVPDVCRVTFDELATEEACARLFEHCLPFPHDHAWWEAYSVLNLQCNLRALYRYYWAHQPQLAKLGKQLKHRTITRMQRPVSDADGVTFQAEPFNLKQFRELVPLFREHAVQTGHAPEDYLKKNVALFARLADLGALQVTTARCNGRLFGYLVSIVAPSFDDAERTEAHHNIFFADAGIKNLGMRLQRAALEALRARGVDEVYMRTGQRGLGPRLASFYRRLGAQPFAELYRLELGRAA